MIYFVGIDTSTTATKALLIDASGNLVAVASSEYTFETPYPLWSEQDPALWWDATIKSVQRILRASGIRGDQVKGIGLTGQMHGLVLLEKKRGCLASNDPVERPAHSSPV